MILRPGCCKPNCHLFSVNTTLAQLQRRLWTCNTQASKPTSFSPTALSPKPQLRSCSTSGISKPLGCITDACKDREAPCLSHYNSETVWRFSRMRGTTQGPQAWPAGRHTVASTRTPASRAAKRPWCPQQHLWTAHANQFIQGLPTDPYVVYFWLWLVLLLGITTYYPKKDISFSAGQAIRCSTKTLKGTAWNVLGQDPSTKSACCGNRVTYIL